MSVKASKAYRQTHLPKEVGTLNKSSGTKNAGSLKRRLWPIADGRNGSQERHTTERLREAKKSPAKARARYSDQSTLDLFEG